MKGKRQLKQVKSQEKKYWKIRLIAFNEKQKERKQLLIKCQKEKGRIKKKQESFYLKVRLTMEKKKKKQLYYLDENIKEFGHHKGQNRGDGDNERKVRYKGKNALEIIFL